MTTISSYDAGAQTQSGLGSVVTSFARNSSANGQMRQCLGFGVQWRTAATASIGGPWALVPSYAVAEVLARWVSLTTQVVWFRSVGSNAGYPEVNLLRDLARKERGHRPVVTMDDGLAELARSR